MNDVVGKIEFAPFGNLTPEARPGDWKILAEGQAKRIAALEKMQRNYRALLGFMHDDIKEGRLSHRLAARRMSVDLHGLAEIFASAGLDNPWTSK